MKFDMEKSVLAEMAEKAKRIASDSLPAEMLRGVCLECSRSEQEVSMIATDLSMSVFLKGPAEVIESGRIVINARLLFDIISHAPGDVVRFWADYKKNMVRIRSQKSTYNIMFLSAKHYPRPDMPFPEDTVKISGIPGMAAKTAFAVNEDSANRALGCICLRTHKNRIQAAASNGSCVMLTKQDADAGEEKQFLLPGKQFLKLAAMSSNEDEYSMGSIQNRVVFMKKGMMVSLETFWDVTFLDTDRVIQSVTPQYTATVDAKDMKNALDMMSVDGEIRIVNILFGKTSVIVSCNGNVSAREELPAKISMEMPKGGFYYSFKDSYHLFRLIHGIAQIKIDKNGLMLVRGRDELFFQLPRRPGEQAKKPESKAKAGNKEKTAKKAAA